MKFYSSLWLTTLLMANTLEAQVDSILFVGNSYTYGNNLPLLFKNLAASAGDTFFVEDLTAGGLTLQNHATNAPHIAKIQQRHWRAFIVQEQSQIPTIDYYFNTLSLPAAAQLNTHFTSKNTCAKVLFYMTWGRRFGGQQCDQGANYCSVNFTDFDHMQDTLKSRYLQLAQSIGAGVSPVGEAWRLALADTTGLVLHTGDNSHANLRGSYLAACVHYASLTAKSPVGLSYTASLSQGWALYLQKKAHQAVLDSQAVYNLDTLGTSTLNASLQAQAIAPSTPGCSPDTLTTRLKITYRNQKAGLLADSLRFTLKASTATGVLLKADTTHVRLNPTCKETLLNYKKAIVLDSLFYHLTSETTRYYQGISVPTVDTLAIFSRHINLKDSLDHYHETFTLKSYLRSHHRWQANFDSLTQNGWQVDKTAEDELGFNPAAKPGCAIATLAPNAGPIWLKTPCLKLYQDYVYGLSFNYANPMATGQSQLNLSVYLADNAQMINATLIKSFSSTTGAVYQNHTDTFAVSANGHFYLGFRAIAQPNNSQRAQLALDDFAVSTLSTRPLSFSPSEAKPLALGLEIYPNPAKGTAQIKFSQAVKQPTIKLTDVLGRNIDVTLERLSAVNYKISGLKPGTYLVHVYKRQQLLGQERLVVY